VLPDAVHRQKPQLTSNFIYIMCVYGKVQGGEYDMGYVAQDEIEEKFPSFRKANTEVKFKYK
jgi:hypothetical protein